MFKWRNRYKKWHPRVKKSEYASHWYTAMVKVGYMEHTYEHRQTTYGFEIHLGVKWK